MTVFRMLDRGSAPTAAEARVALDEAGASAWGFYLGGAGHQSFVAYSRGLLSDLEADGVAFLPIYVGRQAALSHDRGNLDALDALALSATFGDPNRLIVCDIERSASDPNPLAAVEYVRGWTEAMHSHGFLAGVYGSFDLMNAAANGPDPKPDMIWPAVWMANGGVVVPQSHWPAEPNSVSGIDPRLWSLPGQRGWQFAGEQVFPSDGGVNVDVSVIDQACFGVTDNPGPSPTTPSGTTPAAPSGTIVVQPNDVLSVLEATHGFPPGSLFAANHAALDETARRHGLPDSRNGDRIFPGQVLIVPGIAAAPPSPRTIVVQPNDVLSVLEATHGLRPGSLFAANHAALDETARRHGLPDSRNGDKIFPGQVLIVPTT